MAKTRPVLGVFLFNFDIYWMIEAKSHVINLMTLVVDVQINQIQNPDQTFFFGFRVLENQLFFIEKTLFYKHILNIKEKGRRHFCPHPLKKKLTFKNDK